MKEDMAPSLKPDLNYAEHPKPSSTRLKIDHEKRQGSGKAQHSPLYTSSVNRNRRTYLSSNTVCCFDASGLLHL